jgi:L-malate glycosyltransferase
MQVADKQSRPSSDSTADNSAAVRPTTICQLLHGMRVGGAEVLAARLARQLRERYRFVFVCLDELGSLGEQLVGEGFAVHVVGRQPGIDWRCVLRLAGILRREQVDIIHAHQYTPFFYGIAARLRYRHPRIVFTEHGRHVPDYRRWKRVWANRLLLEKRDRVIGVGEVVRNALIQNEGFAPGRVGVIYNGIDLRPYASPAVDRDRVRREIGVEADELVVMLVARFDYLKDHATAVQTIGEVAAVHPRCRLVLVGDGPEMQKTRELVRDLQLERHVVFLGLRNDVPRLWRAADICLLTSISEGIPLTLIEAMAAGVPVVSTNVGGVSEVIEDGASGYLAPSGDPGGLADAVLALAADVRLRREFGGRGQARANARFSEELMHREYCEAYDQNA